MTSSAKFIVFEGIDGSGTSTQSKALVRNFQSSGQKCQHTWEPTDRPIGKLLRQLLSGEQTSSGSAEHDRHLLALLFAADRQDHLWNQEDGIQKVLSNGSHVVCARYVLSSLAYEGEGSDELDFVATINAAYPIPDLTVYLECPVDVALHRITSTRDQIDVFENDAKLSRVKANYTRLIENYPGRILALDATRPAEELSAEIMAALETS
ncbi:MAG: dTMP kinase [Planctomycetota bacterium]|jgi:dTMP kinase